MEPKNVKRIGEDITNNRERLSSLLDGGLSCEGGKEAELG